MNKLDFKKFQALKPRINEIDDLENHDLIYKVISSEKTDRFWEWFSDHDSDYLMERVMYEQGDFELASNRYVETANYFLMLPMYAKDYRFMYAMYEHVGGLPINLANLARDPLLAEIALDVDPEKYSIDDVRRALVVLDDSAPSDAVDEASAVLEEWLESH